MIDSEPGSLVTTHWSMVLAAGQSANPDARKALATLCQTYWPAVYVFIRRQVRNVHDAQDLTQAFFVRLLEGRYLDRADPEKGRFRAFLLTSLKFFVADEADRDRALKRGGGGLVPLEFTSGEARYQREPAHDETPEQIFERRTPTWCRRK